MSFAWKHHKKYVMPCCLFFYAFYYLIQTTCNSFFSHPLSHIFISLPYVPFLLFIIQTCSTVLHAWQQDDDDDDDDGVTICVSIIEKKIFCTKYMHIYKSHMSIVRYKVHNISIMMLIIIISILPFYIS